MYRISRRPILVPEALRIHSSTARIVRNIIFFQKVALSWFSHTQSQMETTLDTIQPCVLFSKTRHTVAESESDLLRRIHDSYVPERALAARTSIVIICQDQIHIGALIILPDRNAEEFRARTCIPIVRDTGR